MLSLISLLDSFGFISGCAGSLALFVCPLLFFASLTLCSLYWILQGAQVVEEIREAFAAFSPVETLVFHCPWIRSPLFEESTKVEEFAEL